MLETYLRGCLFRATSSSEKLALKNEAILLIFVPAFIVTCISFIDDSISTKIAFCVCILHFDSCKYMLFFV